MIIHYTTFTHARVLRNILRIVKRGFGTGVADAASRRIQIDPSQEGGEFGGGHLDAIGGGGRNTEGPASSRLSLASHCPRLCGFTGIPCGDAVNRHGFHSYRPGRALGMTSSGCLAAIQEFFRFASRFSRRISSLSAQTIRYFPDGVRREWTHACLTQ